MSHTLENTRELERFLQKHGFRITEQRKIILDVLASCGWHLTADEIYVEARRRNRHINLATIYRTLTTLRESGLVQQYYVSPDHSESRFRLIAPPTEAPNVEPIVESLHFHCLNCGQITRLDSLALTDLVLKALDTQVSGYRLKQICMCADGYCPKCAKATR